MLNNISIYVFWTIDFQLIYVSLLFQIRPFRQAHFNRDKDRELVGLSRYLRDIVPVEDFTTLNHRKWEK